MRVRSGIRYSDHDSRATAWVAQDLDLATDLPGAFPHALHSETGRFSSAYSSAAVADFEHHRASPIRQIDADTVGAGMPNSISQRLLGDPQKIGFALLGQCVRLTL